METNNEENENKCKTRFKGVENFLRRIAFNLGNSPSQTEVKIISCIPIDVTDLQEKIIQLECQLNGLRAATRKCETEPDHAKSITSSRKESSAKDDKSLKNAAETRKSKKQPEVKTESKNSCSLKNSSDDSQKNTSIVNRAFCDPILDFSTSNSRNQVECGACHGKTAYSDRTVNDRKSTVSFIFPAVPNECMISSDDVFVDTEKHKTNQRRNIFNIRKKSLKKKNNKTELIYYAQTDNFCNDLNTKTSKGAPKSHNSNQDNMNDMFRKQFKLGTVPKKLSSVSEFSSPVCRDEIRFYQVPTRFEFDACSCCRGEFLNIDYDTNGNVCQPNCYFTSARNDTNIYYDSSLYDLVPVKDRPIKISKNLDTLKRIEDGIVIKCWPESVRTKTRYQSYEVNNHTVISTKDIRKPMTKLNYKKDIVINKAIQNDKTKFGEEVSQSSSKTCSVDLGDLKIKRVHKKITTKLNKVADPVHKEAECLNVIVKNIDCQTMFKDQNIDNTVGKTEDTLSNIKSILQCVLAEVKTNSQIKQNNESLKKDAEVQNSVPTAHPCCGMQRHPMNCMYHYPIFIKSPGHPRCSNCFRSSQITKCHENNVATATNAEEIKDEQHTETDKLIREIYKSMALAVDLPTKDSAYTDYDDQRSSIATPVLTQRTDVKVSKPFMSELFRIPRPRTNSSGTYNTTINTSEVGSKSVTMQSQSVNTDNRHSIRNELNHIGFIETESDVELDDDKSTAVESDNKSVIELHNISHDTLSTTSESESENEDKTSESVKEKKKPGLLLKMFNTMFKSKDKKRKSRAAPITSETSDSDDYQTIYSHKTENVRRRQPVYTKKQHGKIVYTNQRDAVKNGEGYKRTPYMEQQCRRHGNEKLLFEEKARKYSSEQFSGGSRRIKPIYYQNYDARSVIIEPKRYIPDEIVANKTYKSSGCERPELPVKLIQGDIFRPKKRSPVKVTSKKLPWLKKRKMGIHCAQQRKKFILES